MLASTAIEWNAAVIALGFILGLVALAVQFSPLPHPRLSTFFGRLCLIGAAGLGLALVISPFWLLACALPAGIAFGIASGWSLHRRGPAAAPVDRVALLRVQYDKGNAIVRPQLIWPPSGPSYAQTDAGPKQSEAETIVCDWARETWLVLRDHFQGYEGDFHGPSTIGTDLSLFSPVCLEAVRRAGTAEAYFEERMRMLAELLKRFDGTPLAPATAGLQTVSESGSEPHAIDATSPLPAGASEKPPPPAATHRMMDGKVELRVLAGNFLSAPESVKCEVTDPRGGVTTTSVPTEVLANGWFDGVAAAIGPRIAVATYPHEFPYAAPLGPGTYRVRWVIPQPLLPFAHRVERDVFP